jgi:hypothetical protein
MATSPREELVITAVVVFGRFTGGWVWAEQAPDGSADFDSGHKSFKTVEEAMVDFFEKRDVDLGQVVDPADAHYSGLIRVTPKKFTVEEYHIRKYKYGAPNPLQTVAS